MTLRPGLVLLDIQLPGRDGFTAAKELASVPLTPAVILISSRDAGSYGDRIQIVELEESRRRIVTAGDEEHRRLEARLRAGAEHRLERLARRLSEAQVPTTNDGAGNLLTELEAQLADLLDELRSLAAGIHPRQLTKSGLAGALEVVAARCRVPVQLSDSPDRHRRVLAVAFLRS